MAEKYNRKIRNPFDLEPEEEELIGRYFKEEYDADFVFVTHYPSKKRPFYAMDDPADSRYTLSFDLLFRGLEITTGGQRIHDYHMLEDKIAARGMTDEGMEQYMDAFKYGMPPHGGLGIGMERLTMQLLGEENVREACLFPRDLNRLDTAGVEPLISLFPVENVFREDKVVNGDMRDELVDLAPRKKDGQYLVPKTVE